MSDILCGSAAVRPSVERNPVRMLIPAVAQVLLVLSACSPGSESSGGLASEAGAAGTGRLVVQVSNLPAGASAAIVVTGPNGVNQAAVRKDRLANTPSALF